MIFKCNHSRIWNDSEYAIGAHCISCELRHWIAWCGHRERSIGGALAACPVRSGVLRSAGRGLVVIPASYRDGGAARWPYQAII